MSRWHVAGLTALSVLVICITLGYAQQSKPAFTAGDYIAIQQLYARYNNAIDSGDAEAFANTFVPDGIFNTMKGHDALVRFVHYWRANLKGGNLRHWNTNLTITPTADGANGSVYLMLIDVSARPPVIASAFKYEDQLVKTPKGWRFKKRVTQEEGPPPVASLKH